MTEVHRLDPLEVVAAVRDLVRKDTERVDDPHFIPEDRIGWHARTPVADDTAGTPYYEPESWRWFDLVDVGFVDRMIVISFRWTDPATPELRYLVLAHADGLPDAGSASAVVRGQLRTLLQPGWRDRVEKRWLSSSTVLIWRSRESSTSDETLKARLHARRQIADDTIWAARRTDLPT